MNPLVLRYTVDTVERSINEGTGAGNRTSQYETEAPQLSGGQQQRIAIARLFLKDPPVIFLDEPTVSLDAIATEQIKNSLYAIKENRTVVIIYRTAFRR